MSLFDFHPYVLPDDTFVTSRHPLIRRLAQRLVNISLASLAVFAVVGSAACALRIVLKY
jgi:hypothetical protein